MAGTLSGAGCLSSVAEPSLRNHLPEEGDGWERTGTRTPDLGELGAEDGIEADYLGPNDVEYRVVVVEWPDAVACDEHSARQWIDVGWPVVVAHESFTVAAGSGTAALDQPPTPEHPPYLDRTPVPGGESTARDLLARSPALSASDVRENDCT